MTNLSLDPNKQYNQEILNNLRPIWQPSSEREDNQLTNNNSSSHLPYLSHRIQNAENMKLNIKFQDKRRKQNSSLLADEMKNQDPHRHLPLQVDSSHSSPHWPYCFSPQCVTSCVKCVKKTFLQYLICLILLLLVIMLGLH